MIRLRVQKYWPVLVVALCLGSSFSMAATLPNGWLLAGSCPAEYEAGMDKKVTHSGSASGFLASKVSKASGFGTLMQEMKVGAYRGKRLRMTAYVKSENVQDWAGLWMRVDGDGKVLEFDNMQKRPIKGTSDWKRFAVVLDVPDQATGVSFGILVAGLGRVWVDDFQFETVGKDVPTTGFPQETPETTIPENLGFEE